jgi:eukaryotic-like serine/threonine-protein kinase
LLKAFRALTPLLILAAVVLTSSRGADGTVKPVVLRPVQGAIKSRSPQQAYVPTRLPPGYRYLKYVPHRRNGFDLYFSCCGERLPLISFDADGAPPPSCAPGRALRTFRIGGAVVGWSSSPSRQQAWRCIRHGLRRVLVTVSGESPRSGRSSARSPRQLALMVASTRAIAGVEARVPGWPQFRFGPAHTGAAPYEHVLTPSDVSRLTLAWTLTTGGAIWSSPAVVHGVVYVGSNDGHIYALRLSDGSLVWKSPLAGRPSAPAVVGGVVYVTADDARAYAFDAATGQRLWRAQLFGGEGGFPAAPTVAEGMVFVLTNETLTALDARTGVTRWQERIGCFGCPVAFDRGLVYAAASVPTDNPGPAHLYAFGARTGAERWKATLRNSAGSSPAVRYGVVYVGVFVESASGVRPWAIAAFDAATGSRSWQTGIGRSRYLTFASPAVAGGRVVFPSTAGTLVALDAKTGRTDWRVPLEITDSAPAIANGVVYVGSSDDYLHAFDARRGRELWRAQTGDDVTSSPAVVNGTVLVGCDDGVLRAFRLPSSRARS